MEPLSIAYRMDPAPHYDWSGAARIAANCAGFHPDEDDEQVADEPVSCFNCRYRRWTVSAFTCCRKKRLTGSIAGASYH